MAVRTLQKLGLLNGHVQPGDVVAIVGAGPIGLSAIIGAQLYSPATVIAIDLADSRLEAAKAFVDWQLSVEAQLQSVAQGYFPIFPDLTAIRASKHYRPGEHLYYFTEDGLVRWMALHGFLLRERNDFETRAGRDSILSFAFLRD